MYVIQQEIFMKHTLPILLAAAVLFGCRNSSDKSTEKVIEKTAVQVQDGRFTPELMWSLGQLEDFAVSPDGELLVYLVSYTDMAQNKSNTEIYLLPVGKGSDAVPVRLTVTADSETNPVWKDNRTIFFCRDTQILSMDIKTKKEKVIAENDGGFEGFKLSSDGTKMLYCADVPVKRPENIEKLYQGLDKTTGRIETDLMYRHWDSWTDSIPHIFFINIQNGKKADLLKAVDIIGAGQPFECPMRPFGGLEEVDFSPDGSKIAYTCRKKTGSAYAVSTNSDIYIYDIQSGSTVNVSEGIMGYDQNPVFSHDGNKLAWESMERDGYESDKLRLMVQDLKSGIRTDYSQAFDYGVSNIRWSDDDSELTALVPYRGTQEIFTFNTADRTIRQVTKGKEHDINKFQLSGETVYAAQASQSCPAELYTWHLDDNEAAGTKVTSVNDDVLSEVHMGKSEARWIKTKDGKDMLVWLIYPYDYDPAKKYPALLFCEGGPQVMVSQFWSRRWNFQVMSGAGYFIIAPNRRGCPGFGTKWCESVSRDYGGLCMQDYIQSVEVLSKEIKSIDSDRIGACGASFGGYSIYWLAGHNENHLFKAFLAHDGIFNMEQFYLETDEDWTVNWEFGGPYWQEERQNVEKTYAQSPHLFVDKWNTPICIIHSQKDYRILDSQGFAAFDAAKMRGLDARLLFFPDENHWVCAPQNSLLWNRTFIDWFDTYLKK